MSADCQDGCCTPSTVLDLEGNRWLRQGSDLPVIERRLLGLIVQYFIEHGSAPDGAALQTMARAATVELAPALASLAAHDLLILDADAKTLLGAYPFSAVPTDHRVAIDGHATVFAMCAVDALGIGFLAGRDTTIHSRDTSTGEALRMAVDVQTGTVTTDQPDIVMFSPSAAYEGSAATCICPVIAFFRSAVTALAYSQANPRYEGRIMPLDEAVIAGRRIFENPGNFFPTALATPTR